MLLLPIMRELGQDADVMISWLAVIFRPRQAVRLYVVVTSGDKGVDANAKAGERKVTKDK
jgi:hypothetical protein